MTHHLAGVAEIAVLLGVSRQRVSQLSQTKDFPEPVANLAAGPVWEASAIEAWARETGRRVGRESAESPQDSQPQPTQPTVD